MKHVVGITSGIVVLIPESDSDRLLLFHLMNCGDFNRFEQYLKTDVTEGMTEELGIEAHEFIGYLTAGEERPFRGIEQMPRIQEAQARETGDREQEARLIGFER